MRIDGVGEALGTEEEIVSVGPGQAPEKPEGLSSTVQSGPTAHEATAKGPLGKLQTVVFFFCKSADFLIHLIKNLIMYL